jgi:predicted metal-dependent phosphoesterase TrpH
MPRQSFKYETHLHTSEVSPCSRSSGAEMARAHRAAGYAGIIVTDHFYNGNIRMPADLPWETRVDLLGSGYRAAKAEGERIGLSVFFGWEYSFRGTDFLTYGLDCAFLLDNPDLLELSVTAYLDLVRRSGGFVCHAHPFREADYIQEIRLFPGSVDSVEVENASHRDPVFNRRAAEYAKQHGLLEMRGSDIHDAARLPGGGMSFDHPAETIGDFIGLVRAQRG